GGAGGMNDETVTVALTPFSVPPGGEMFECQRFRNPFGGRDVEIRAWDAHLAVGSHHSFLFFDDMNTDGPLESCSGLTFAPFAVGTQQPENSYAFPPGIGELIPGNVGFRIIVHFLNTTGQTLQASVSYVAHKAPPGTVTMHAGTYFFNNSSISVPPDGMPHTLTHSCTVFQNLQLLSGVNHMHSHATDFLAETGGQTLVHSQVWSDPPFVLFNPPFSISAGQQVNFSCTYVNNTGSTLTFGESAATNEMCIFTGLYFPVAAGSDPTIGCLL
ncbi:MAG TPA: hypothetical protein VKN99_26955, partial [Polyangia bacterium]|nr:hypothetical protein [Polyangia bacterium]